MDGLIKKLKRVTESNDYPYIRAWGRYMGSNQRYIEDQVELARAEDAPQDAIYRGDDGKWPTFDSIESDAVKKSVNIFVRA